MASKRRVLAVIPARGGSKGIPGKNMVTLAGKPLLWWTLNAAKNATCITDIIVSSDDKDILHYAEDCGVCSLARPAALATDSARSEPVITHALQVLSKQNKNYDDLILLQPTSPLRTANHIDDAYDYWNSEGADALISVKRIPSSVLKSFFVGETGRMSGIVDNVYPFMPRQLLPDTYTANGAIYMVKVASFLSGGALFQDDTLAYKMEQSDSIDIDCIDDLQSAEQVLQSMLMQS